MPRKAPKARLSASNTYVRTIVREITPSHFRMLGRSQGKLGALPTMVATAYAAVAAPITARTMSTKLKISQPDAEKGPLLAQSRKRTRNSSPPPAAAMM